jgi:hypothetical protein
MNPKDKAEELIIGFLNIVEDYDKAKECAEYFVTQTINECYLVLQDWWREVFDEIGKFK